VFLIRVGHERVGFPQLWTKVSIGGTEGIENGLDKVTHGTCVTARTGVAIIDSGHMQKLLSGRRRNKSSTARGRYETNTDGSALSGDLAGNSVGHATLTSPVSTTDGGDIELGTNDSSTDSSGDFGGALNSKTQMSGGISDGNKGLETSTLSSRRLLLDGHDLHDLIQELVLKEVVDDLTLLDGKGKEEDLFDRSNLLFLYKASKLGDRDPDVLVITSLATSTASSASTATSTASTTTFAATFAASESSSSSFSLWCVSHDE